MRCIISFFANFPLGESEFEVAGAEECLDYFRIDNVLLVKIVAGEKLLVELGLTVLNLTIGIFVVSSLDLVLGDGVLGLHRLRVILDLSLEVLD